MRKPCFHYLLSIIISGLFFLTIWYLRKWNINYASDKWLEDNDVLTYDVPTIQKDKGLNSMNRVLTDLELTIKQNSDPLPKISPFGSLTEEDICSGEDIKRCVRLPVERPLKLAVLPANKLLLCIIPKNGATISLAMFCYLNNPERWLNAGIQMHDAGNFCNSTHVVNERCVALEDAVRRFNYSSVDEWFTDWTTAVSIRDPIEHFISGYVDVCIRRMNPCYGCQRNMTCFIIKHYEHSMKIRNTPFGDVELHIRPQSNNCQLKKRTDEYQKLSFERYLEHVTVLLRRAKVDERHIRYINESLSTHYTPHSTNGMPARQFYAERLISSPFLMEYFLRIFYEDYWLFNFPIPRIRF